MALPEATGPKEAKKAGDRDDGDFDPSAQALIDEIDDERTLEEEEALGGIDGKAVQEELDELKKESEMPIEELMAYYQRMREDQGDHNSDEEDEEDEEVEDEYEDEEGEEEDDDEVKDVTKNIDRVEGARVKERARRDEDVSIDGAGRSRGQQEPNTTGPEKGADSPKLADERSSSDVKQELSGSLNQQDQHHQKEGDAIKQSETSKILSQSHSDIMNHLNKPNDVNQLNDSQQQENADGSKYAVGVHIEVTPSAHKKQRRSITELLLDADGPMIEKLLGYDFDDSDELDEDYSYTDDENDEDERDWKRYIHIGPDYQAEVPEGLHEYSDLPPYETQDTLVWKCNADLSEEQIVDYLEKGSLLCKRNEVDHSTDSALKKNFFQYEEQLLYLLSQCNYNLDEALRRRKLDPLKYFLHEPMTVWSQEECLNFESGLRIHGKDFRAIRENKVSTRTRAEVVAFYYLWKKSERHDVYINQYKLDRKRSLSHPGTTDYMDKFIEDNESNLNVSSSSSSSSSSTPSSGQADSVVGSTNPKTDLTNVINTTASSMYHSIVDDRYGRLLAPNHGLENNFATECSDD